MGTDHSIKKIILFDGVCNLCNASVQFIIKHDFKKVFYFASLQSAFGQSQLTKCSTSTNIDTIILIKDEKFYFRSDAALEIAKELSGWWLAFSVFRIFPRFFRDFVYNFVSRNRYWWFGKTDQCYLPTPELTTRFIS